MLARFSIWQSEANSTQPCDLAQFSTAATNRRPTPRLRKAGCTKMPSTYATGAVVHPSAEGRSEASMNPQSKPSVLGHEGRQRTAAAEIGVHF
jgi:hypothetical protein